MNVSPSRSVSPVQEGVPSQAGGSAPGIARQPGQPIDPSSQSMPGPQVQSSRNAAAERFPALPLKRQASSSEGSTAARADEKRPRVDPPQPKWLRVASELPTESVPPGIRHKLVATDGFRKREVKLGMQLDHKDDAHTVAGNLGVDDMVRIAPKAVTHNIHDCTAVILNNGEAGTEGHFIPRPENLDSNVSARESP